MPKHVAPQRHEMPLGATRDIPLDFSGHLATGETLASVDDVTATVDGVAANDVTISNEQVNAAALTVGQKVIPIGKAAVWRVTGGTATTRYKFIVTVTTSTGQELIGHCFFNII